MISPKKLSLVILVLLIASCDQHTPDGSEPPPNARTVRCTQEFGDPDSSLYILPFPVGHSYRLIQSYCSPNPAWGHHQWLAYDFDLKIGDTIVASRAGTVIFVLDAYADGTRICGEENYVYIQHSDGTVMGYVHLTPEGAYVQVGDVVDQGDPIGRSGDSGCSSGPHLHVSLLKDGTNYNAENTKPFNYRNAEGPLDVRHGLVLSQTYKALPYP